MSEGMHSLQRVLLVTLAAAPALGQKPRAEFEVASVKPSAPGAPDRFNIGVRIDGAFVIVKEFSLKNYIALAYGVRDFQVSGPDWLGSSKFDLNAKFPEGFKRGQLPEMVESLLADRFKLALHREKKEFAIYALVVGKGGAKLKESAPDSESDTTAPDKPNVNVSATGGGRGGTTVNLGKGSYISNGNGRVEAHKVTIGALLDTLSRFVDHPIVDMTGLTGKYDLSLAYGVDDLRMALRSAGVDRPLPDDALPPASIFESVKEVGLMLERRKAALDVLIIDHIEKAPVAN